MTGWKLRCYRIAQVLIAYAELPCTAMVWTSLFLALHASTHGHGLTSSLGSLVLAGAAVALVDVLTVTALLMLAGRYPR
jgi:hypothetical protein